LVKRLFRNMSENRVKRYSFTRVTDLKHAIAHYIDHHKKNPKPFIPTASAVDTFTKVTRANAAVARVTR
jgi:hypothetical protein